MKSLGIVRPVDALGRIVIPIELRRVLGISSDDMMEIYTEGESIFLKKFKNKCTFCGSNEICIDFMGQLVCRDCVDKLSIIGEES